MLNRGDINPSDGYPEDTLAAFKFAAFKQCLVLKADVQTTSDGVWYLMHDTTVDRTTNGTGSVSALTAAQMDALWIDGGYGYNSARHASLYHPPTLTSVLDAVAPYGVTLQLQCKGTSDVTVLASFLSTRGDAGRIILNERNIL